MSNDKEQLLQQDAEWARLAAEGDHIESILSYWTDDAIVIPPGLPPVEGKQALRAYVEGSRQIPGFRITWESESDSVRFSPDGRLAYLFSRNSVTMNAADGTPATTYGRAVTIWRLEGDGKWRCAVDIWNAGP